MSPPCWWWRLDQGHDLLCYLIMMLLLDMTMELACIWTKCVWWFPTTLLPLFMNSCCNNYVTPMYEILVNYLWNGCNMWLLCWITTILVVCKLVWNPSWFQFTTEFIWAQVREFDHFGDRFCTYALINWTVLRQLHPTATFKHHQHWAARRTWMWGTNREWNPEDLGSGAVSSCEGKTLT